MNLNSNSPRSGGWLMWIVMVGLAGGAGLVDGQGKGKAKSETNAGHKVTEVFQVSRVGTPNSAESRDRLMALYEKIAREHNSKVKSQAARQKAYRGEQVRILKSLGESDENGPLYLCAYQGKPSVISIKGKKMPKGKSTPALKIEQDGTHTTMVTRIVKEEIKGPGGKPALKVVDEEEPEVVTFFGIPVDVGDSSERKKKPKTIQKEITEEKILPKFKASVSTELLNEGPPLMSTALFLDNVKNGQVYKISRTEERRCKECVGFGRVSDTRPRKLRKPSPDGKMACPECKEKGSRSWLVTYIVSW